MQSWHTDRIVLTWTMSTCFWIVEFLPVFPGITGWGSLVNNKCVISLQLILFLQSTKGTLSPTEGLFLTSRSKSVTKVSSYAFYDFNMIFLNKKNSNFFGIL